MSGRPLVLQAVIPPARLIDGNSEEQCPSGPTLQKELACTPFVVFTMQRSSSTEAMEFFNKSPSFGVAFEAFNFGQTQSGFKLAKELGLSIDKAKNISFATPMQWAMMVFESLQRSFERGKPCAVGFKCMGPGVDEARCKFLWFEPKLKKIILERKDTYDQWFSKERACWTGDWGTNPEKHKDDAEELARKKAKQGEYCNMPFDKFRKQKLEYFHDIRACLRNTGQTHLDVAMEDFIDPSKTDQIQQEMRDFILTP